MATGLSYYRLESCHVATRMVSLAMSAMSTAWLAGVRVTPQRICLRSGPLMTLRLTPLCTPCYSHATHCLLFWTTQAALASGDRPEEPSLVAQALKT
jgi:hypothetical protein